MNRATLTKLLAALKAAIDEVEPELAEKPDGFAVHVYHSRRAYFRQSDRKGTKRAEQEAHRSYQQALKFGFRGDGRAWVAVLTACSNEQNTKDPKTI